MKTQTGVFPTFLSQCFLLPLKMVMSCFLFSVFIFYILFFMIRLSQFDDVMDKITLQLVSSATKGLQIEHLAYHNYP